MYDLTRPGHSTALYYREISFQPDIEEDMFSVRRMQQ
jgi:hypothetical protein